MFLEGSKSFSNTKHSRRQLGDVSRNFILSEDIPGREKHDGKIKRRRNSWQISTEEREKLKIPASRAPFIFTTIDTYNLSHHLSRRH